MQTENRWIWFTLTAYQLEVALGQTLDVMRIKYAYSRREPVVFGPTRRDLGLLPLQITDKPVERCLGSLVLWCLFAQLQTGKDEISGSFQVW